MNTINIIWYSFDIEVIDAVSKLHMSLRAVSYLRDGGVLIKKKSGDYTGVVEGNFVKGFPTHTKVFYKWENILNQISSYSPKYFKGLKLFFISYKNSGTT